jgi:hypothetical protein
MRVTGQVVHRSQGGRGCGGRGVDCAVCFGLPVVRCPLVIFNMSAANGLFVLWQTAGPCEVAYVHFWRD